MSAPGTPLPPQVLTLVNSLTESRVLVGACDAVLFWEWLTCLPSEIRYIWRAELRFTTLLFLLLRYFTFVTMGILSWLFFWTGSEELCGKMIVCIHALPSIVMALAHILIAVRVYALYDKNKYILVLLSTIILVQFGINIWLSTLITAVPRMTPLISYCLPQTKHQYALAWGLPMAYDTVVLILGAVKLTSIWRAGGRSRLVQVLFRDQIVWYSIMTVVSILNLVVAYAMPPPPGSETRGVVSSVLVTLTSISACRVVLNIRQTAAEERNRAPSSGHTDGHPEGSKNNSRRFTLFAGVHQNTANVPPFTSSNAGGSPRTPVSPSFKVQPYHASVSDTGEGKFASSSKRIQAIEEEERDEMKNIELGDAGKWNGRDHHAAWNGTSCLTPV